MKNMKRFIKSLKRRKRILKLVSVILILISVVYIILSNIYPSKKYINADDSGFLNIISNEEYVIEKKSNLSFSNSTSSQIIKKEIHEDEIGGSKEHVLLTTTTTTSTIATTLTIELLQVLTEASTEKISKSKIKELEKSLEKYSLCIQKNFQELLSDFITNTFDEVEEILRRSCFMQLFGKIGNKCEWPPKKLVGPLFVDMTPMDMNELHDNVLTFVQPGGTWSPKHCNPRQEVVIIIPYRDRESHLSIFLRQIHSILKRQEYSYRILVIEQIDEYPFNRGKLMNVGYKEATNISSFSCFIFHDVDLIPENDMNDYGCPTSPRHLSNAIDKFDYRLPYPGIFGGVEAFLKQDFERLNGFPNSYWGWGAEDDDLYKRVIQNGFTLTRPSMDEGRYKMIKHKDAGEAPPNRHEKLNNAHTEFQTDGISSLQYRVLEKDIKPLYTLIKVDLNMEGDLIY